MKVIVLQPTIIGGVDYQPTLGGEFSNIPDPIAQHMIAIGNAQPYEAKVLEVVEKKAVKKSAKKTSSVSQPDPVSQEPPPKKRRGRPPKSSQ
jgi:hypothetical protein